MKERRQVSRGSGLFFCVSGPGVCVCVCMCVCGDVRAWSRIMEKRISRVSGPSFLLFFIIRVRYQLSAQVTKRDCGDCNDDGSGRFYRRSFGIIPFCSGIPSVCAPV